MNDTPAERGTESTWARLRRRKVVQWTVAYAAGGWVLLKPLAMLGVAIGLPVVVTLAWFHGESERRA